ncbi:MAG: ABC transporter permease, partial [Bacteroidales bacterium]|nr:ABC transporter permease [Bacteroidales bacterium]
MEIKDISWVDLFLGYTLLIIPLAIFWYYKSGLVLNTIISVLRMTIQLFLVGLYLKYLFELNNAWVNVGWVLIMIIISTITTIRKSELSFRMLALPVAIGSIIALFIVNIFFLAVILRLENIFDARYFIAITGLIMGNMMERNIIVLSSFYTNLSRNSLEYNYAIASGANKREAVIPFMREALKLAFNPVIAKMTIMGLIALPGTMTGQILGGSSPEIAIKYQIVLMLMVFIASMITVVVTVAFANKKAF